jgi:hypothetical protein
MQILIHHPTFLFLIPLLHKCLLQDYLFFQAHLNAMANKGQSGLAAPVINVVMPNDMFGFLHPAPALSPLPVPPTAVPQPPAGLQPLIPPDLQPGSKQDIAIFCCTYGLSDEVLAKFRAHAYTGTQAF